MLRSYSLVPRPMWYMKTAQLRKKGSWESRREQHLVSMEERPEEQYRREVGETGGEEMIMSTFQSTRCCTMREVVSHNSDCPNQTGDEGHQDQKEGWRVQ